MTDELSPSEEPTAVVRTLRCMYWAGAFALVAVLGTVGVLQVMQTNSEGWVRRAREAARGVRHAELLAVARESAIRGYVLTGDSTLLARELALRGELETRLASLARMLSGNAQQQQHLATIRGALARWDREYAYPALQSATLPTAVPSNRHAGTQLFDPVRLGLEDVLRTEDAFYASRSRHDRVIRLVGALTLMVEILVIGVVLYWFRRRVLGQAKDIVAKQQQFMRQAEDLERHTAELGASTRSLQQTEDRYRRLVESAPYGLLVHCEGRIVFANTTAYRLLGATCAEEIVGRQVFDIVHPDSCELVRTRMRYNIDAGETTPLVEMQLRRLDGTAVEIETVGIPFVHNGVKGAQTVFHDISARKRLEVQLRQAQKMEAVGQLAGGVAHDFNNLLTVITSYSGMLLQELASADPMRADVEEIRRAAERASGLTRQLLAFSRQQVMRPEVLDVNTVVRDLQKMLRRVLPEDVALVTNLAPTLGLVSVDVGQLEQVIVNLAVNARDAMPSGGTLTVETADVELGEECRDIHPELVPGPHVMLAVSDTGVGMDAATQAQIFEPFYTTKEPGKGTGLGLSTVYGIVKQSGGHVWVSSEPGAGTTFKLYLPCEGPAGAPSLQAESPPPMLKGTETILLVEDDPAVRAATRRMLARSGYRILEARDGGEALHVMRADGGLVELVVTDVVMPEKSGLELAGLLRLMRPDVAVLFMSGYAESELARQVLVAPRSVFLQKPFTAEELARKVREALGACAEAA